MKRKWLMPLLALLLLPAAALAQELPFLSAGISLSAPPEWTVLTPATLDAHQALLEGLGADPAAVKADYAGNQIAFEVYLPGGGQVSLAVQETEQTLGWENMAHMQLEQAQALYARYDRAPYEHLAYTESPPGCLSFDWTQRAAQTEVSFARLVFVNQGALYTLTAMGTLPVDALHEANRMVFDAMTLLGVRVQTHDAVITAIDDDGTATPLALVDFTGITQTDSTELLLRTLPGAEVVLRTATDTLRAVANELGLHRFTLSTRREAAYTYTVWATAQGREASKLEVMIVRRLSGEAQMAAYRNLARWLESSDYRNIAASPALYTGSAYTLRGRAAAFGRANGFQTVLVHTSNPSTGTWRNPLWLLLTEPADIAEGDMLNIYGEIRGDALPYTDESGEQAQAPVLINWMLTK